MDRIIRIDGDDKLDEAPASVLEQRRRSAVAEAYEWGREAERARRYYRSQQWQDMTERERKRIIPIVINIIRRPLDRLVAGILDAEPIVNPRGRSEKDYSFAKLLLEALKWSRDEENNWFNDFEDAITDMAHMGEGYIEELWDWSAGNGLGMPRAKWHDPRFVVFDPTSRSWQREDAGWWIKFPPQKCGYLSQKWEKELDGAKVRPDVPDLMLAGSEIRAFADYDRERGRNQGPPGASDYRWMEDMAYEQTMWTKRYKWLTRFIGPDAKVVLDKDKKPAESLDGLFLDDASRKALRQIKIPVPEIWETVVVNEKKVKHEVADFDKSKGGHGEFPIGSFSLVRLRDRARAMGEINFLVGLQDMENRTASRWAEQLLVAGTNYVWSVKGSMPSESKEKLTTISDNPMQHLEVYPGFNPPQPISGNPTGAQLFASGTQMFQQWFDQVAGDYQVNRGDMPYQTSGKGIRALQSSADLLNVIVRRHVESGLRQTTILRLGNILQNMRGARLAEVMDAKTREGKRIYIGSTMAEIQQEYRLPTLVRLDPQTEAMVPVMNPLKPDEPLMLADPATNEPVETLVLNEDTVKGLDFRRITFELDTGKERNRQERQQFAETLLQYAGPAALKWALELMDAPNREQLEEDLRQNNAAQGLLAQVADLAKKFNTSEDQIMEFMFQQVQQAAAQANQPAPVTPPAGPPGQVPPEGPPAVAAVSGGPVGPGEA